MQLSTTRLVIREKIYSLSKNPVCRPFVWPGGCREGRRLSSFRGLSHGHRSVRAITRGAQQSPLLVYDLGDADRPEWIWTWEAFSSNMHTWGQRDADKDGECAQWRSFWHTWDFTARGEQALALSDELSTVGRGHGIFHEETYGCDQPARLLL